MIAIIFHIKRHDSLDLVKFAEVAETEVGMNGRDEHNRYVVADNRRS